MPSRLWRFQCRPTAVDMELIPQGSCRQLRFHPAYSRAVPRSWSDKSDEAGTVSFNEAVIFQKETAERDWGKVRLKKMLEDPEEIAVWVASRSIPAAIPVLGGGEYLPLVLGLTRRSIKSGETPSECSLYARAARDLKGFFHPVNKKTNNQLTQGESLLWVIFT